MLEGFGVVLAEQIGELTKQIYGLAGEEFNINSPLQLGNILFEKLRLPAGKKTKRGYSTSADILEKLMDKHPIIPLILEYRTVSKLKSTYVDGLIPLISSTDGKVHAHFNQTVTDHGQDQLYRAESAEHPDPSGDGPETEESIHPGRKLCTGGS